MKELRNQVIVHWPNINRKYKDQHFDNWWWRQKHNAFIFLQLSLSDDYEYLVCYIWFVKRVTTPCYCSWAITITTGTVVQSDSDVSFWVDWVIWCNNSQWVRRCSARLRFKKCSRPHSAFLMFHSSNRNGNNDSTNKERLYVILFRSVLCKFGFLMNSCWLWM